MSRSFSETTRSLQNDRPFGALVLLGFGFLFLTLWAVWFLKSQISIQKTSIGAQLVQSDQVSILNAHVNGTISQVFVELGASVKKGESIAELNHELVNARLIESEESLQRINTLLARYKEEYQDLLVIQLEEVESMKDQLDALKQQELNQNYAVAVQQEIVELHEQLDTQNSGSRLELKNALLEQGRLKADVTSTQAQIAYTSSNLSSLLKQQQHEQMQMLRNISELEQEQTTTSSIHQQNSLALQHHFIRAPSAGIVSALPVLRVGQFLTEGERVGSISSFSDLIIDARFLAADAIGYIEVGQKARVKADGFEWTKYGTILAEVSKVASSIHEGHLRVELKVLDSPDLLPLRPDMPVSVDVAVESISPYSLILKSAANWLN